MQVASKLPSLFASRSEANEEASTRPAPDRVRKSHSPSDLSLRIQYYWGGNLVGTSLHELGRPVVIGSGRDEAQISAENLGGRQRFTIARPLDGLFSFAFDSSTKGLLHTAGKMVPLSVLRDRSYQQADGTLTYPLGADDVVWLELGGMLVGLSYVPREGSRQPSALPQVLRVIAAIGCVAFASLVITAWRWRSPCVVIRPDSMTSVLLAVPEADGPRIDASIYTGHGSQPLGRFATDAVNQVVRKHWSEVQACLGSEAPKTEPARLDAPVAVLALIIKPGGEVASAAVESRSLSSAEHDCLSAEAESWQFRGLGIGNDVMVTVPMYRWRSARPPWQP